MAANDPGQPPLTAAAASRDHPVPRSALEAHESQFETTMHATGNEDLEPFRQRIRGRLAELGAPHGLTAAEAFALLTDL